MKITTEISKPNRRSAAATTGRLFFLEASGGRIHSANADGSDRKVILDGCRVPDGIVVDLEAGSHLLDQHGRSDSKRWLDRARRSRRSESQNDRSRRQYIHAEATPSR